jgi:predicted nucleic acid-binding protein
MPSVRRRIYCDANVFLSYVNELPGRVGDIDAMFAEAQRGEIQIITSTLTVAEVAFATVEQDAKATDPAIQARIDALWELGSPFQLVDFHLLIAEKARDLQRLGLPLGWKGLRSIDAMHLATAQHEQVDELNTYDAKLPRYASLIGCPIREPQPSQPQLGLGSTPP